MISLGHFALLAAFIVSLYGLLGGLWGAKRGNVRLQRSAANAVLLVAGLSVVSLLCLAYHFLTHDYRLAYVWQHSNNEMAKLYLVSAIWGGMDGSMLLWAVMGAVFSAIAVHRTAAGARELRPWATAFLSGSTCFFLGVVALLTNPFRVIPSAVLPENGQGLNPLLQNPSMLIHPVFLYAGFTGFVVPFAFCLAALASGKLNNAWMHLTRRWTLVAWGFLTAGIILGGHWAYIELGWGGFWAWDPVENSSFLPWLTATAYLHSAMVQERRGMLKIWNVSLCCLTYLLTVFGTFLTRSGIVQSVHAFAETDVGWVFLLYIGGGLTVSAALIVARRKALASENVLESYLSREAAFLFNNLALLGICFATMWGVLFPVLSEAISGEQSVVGAPFFNMVNVPLFLILLFLMGVGPLIAWRRASRSSLLRTFLRPFVAGSLIFALFITIDPARVGAAVSFGLCVFVLATIMGEFHRALRARRELTSENPALGLVRLVRRKPQRYGGYIVHLGVVVMAVSITASMVYKIEKDITLAPGDAYQLGNYRLELTELTQRQEKNFSVLAAQVRVFDPESGKQLGTLHPEQRFYPASQQTTSEVDIRMTPRDDLYIALGGLETGTDPHLPVERSRAVFKVFVNPLQMWLWFGSVIVLGGTLLVVFAGLAHRVPAAQPSAVVGAAAPVE